MGFFTIVAAATASVLLALAPMGAYADQTYYPLPFDGRIQTLTMSNLWRTYLLHIFQLRPNGTTGDPADYLKINQTGRLPAYNGDTGVISVAVDDKAIFKDQTNFRRSELVQFIDGNPTGSTFFSVSIRAEDTILNKYQWQVVFPESHIWDVYIDFSQTPPQLQFLAENDTLLYETEFKYKTWTNVGIDVQASGLITFYTSEEDAPIKPVYTTATALTTDEIPTNYEFHFGMLLYWQTPNPPMVQDHQDVLQFSGVTVNTTAPDSGDGSSSDTVVTHWRQ